MFEKRFLSLRSWRQRLVIEAAEATDSGQTKILVAGLTENPLSPAHAGSKTFSTLIPHAPAWGYMLSPVTQAR
jgi:hypothetical protein